jgi:murein DD-endopeptidase MepM/ murein hydrolase activator NlpD
MSFNLDDILIKKHQMNDKFINSNHKKIFLFSFLVIIVFVILNAFVPYNYVMPVKGAGIKSYSQKSFWAYPWGKSGHHKGVDIFAKQGTPVLSATKGMVVYVGQLSLGGNVVLVVGPRFKSHYYAHLKKIKTTSLSLVSEGEEIGEVGTTGNAKGKPPHLHYSIGQTLPNVFGEGPILKRFYTDPTPLLNKGTHVVF